MSLILLSLSVILILVAISQGARKTSCRLKPTFVSWSMLIFILSGSFMGLGIQGTLNASSLSLFGLIPLGLVISFIAVNLPVRLIWRTRYKQLQS